MPETPTDVEHDIFAAGRRSDRWDEGRRRVNLWAIAAILAALLGASAVATLVAATAEVTPFDTMTEDAALALGAAGPGLGVLAFFTGLAARRRPGLHPLAWVAIVVGSLLIVLAVAAIVVFVTASRSLSTP